MNTPKRTGPAGCLGALVGGAAFCFTTLALSNDPGLGIGLGFWFGAPLGALLAAAGATAAANRRRPPGTPAASVRGHLGIAGVVGVLLLVSLAQFGQQQREAVRRRTADRQFQVLTGPEPNAELYTWLHAPQGGTWDEHSERGHWDSIYREVGALTVDGQPGTLARQIGPPGLEVFIPAPGARSPRLLQRRRPADPWQSVGPMRNRLLPSTDGPAAP